MLLEFICHALARFAAFLHAAIPKQLCELLEVCCLLETCDPAFHFVVVFCEGEWQVSEVPEQLAALAFVCAVVVTVEEDGDVHDGSVEGSAAVVGEEGVAGGEEFVHVIDGADVDKVFIFGVRGDMTGGELGMKAEEDDPATAEFFPQGMEQAVVVGRVVAFFNRAVRRLAAATKRRAVHDDLRLGREVIFRADRGALPAPSFQQDVASR